MTIYYFIWFFFFSLSIAEIHYYGKQDQKLIQSYICIICCILLILITSLKGNVGSDYSSYGEKYHNIKFLNHYDWIIGIEPGFWYWMKFCTIIGLSYVQFWALTAVINIGSKFYAFAKLSPLISVSVSIYFLGLFFERDFDGVRQGLSIGVGYFALIAYLAKKNKLYLLLAAIACSIHYTSVIFFLLPILNRKLSQKFIFGSILIGVIAVIFKMSFFNLQSVTWGYDNAITARLSNYSSLEEYSSSVGLSIGILTRILFLYVFIRICRGRMPFTMFNVICNGFFLAIMASLIFNDFVIVSHRLFYGFREFQIFIVPWIIISLRGRSVQLLGTVLTGIYCLILLFRLLHSNMAVVYNYKTFF